MTVKYYIISYQDARQLGVTSFRRGTPQKGYVVNSGDFGLVNTDVRERATEVSEQEAMEFISKL